MNKKIEEHINNLFEGRLFLDRDEIDSIAELGYGVGKAEGVKWANILVKEMVLEMMDREKQ